jgi:putative NADH-flavin reductase
LARYLDFKTSDRRSFMPATSTQTTKIIVFGASGEVGRRMVAEAAQRGHRVTAVARRGPGVGVQDRSISTLIRDVETADDLEQIIAEHDFVISALRPQDGEEAKLVDLTAAVVTAATAAGRKFIVVGGAAALRLPNAHDHTVLTAPGFLPESVVPIATACQRQHDWILPELGDSGAYLCPPAMLTPGTRTGSYRVGDDTLVADDDGNSHISMEDFAVAALDEAEHPNHTGRRFTVGD